MPPESTLRILRLNVENVKRIRAVDITPGKGAIVQITGKNGQGKSSVLDSIMYALGGGRTLPEKPIRRGAEKADIELDLGELVVRRTITKTGGTLTITGKDGSKLNSPQAILDKLASDLTFDPLEFCRMDAKAQLTVLRQVTGVGEACAKIEAAMIEAAAERTNVNRDLRTLEARLAAVPEVDAPDEEVSLSDLVQEHGRLTTLANERRTLKSNVDAAVASVEKWKIHVHNAEEKLKEAKDGLRKAQLQTEDMRKKLDVGAEPDVASVASRIASAESTNRLVNQKRMRGEILAAVRAAEDKSKALRRRHEDLTAERESLISGSKLPVKGLSFGEEGVLYNGVPFAQASTSEQLRVSVAMGLAQQPRLRVMLVRDASLLDEDAMRDLEKIAGEHDAQLWVERVASGEPVGIVIEDGEVSEVVEGAGQ